MLPMTKDKASQFLFSIIVRKVLSLGKKNKKRGDQKFKQSPIIILTDCSTPGVRQM